MTTGTSTESTRKLRSGVLRMAFMKIQFSDRLLISVIGFTAFTLLRITDNCKWKLWALLSGTALFQPCFNIFITLLKTVNYYKA